MQEGDDSFPIKDAPNFFFQCSKYDPFLWYPQSCFYKISYLTWLSNQ
jgi:hypothetical protein